MAAPLILVEAQPRNAATGALFTTRLAGGGGGEPSYYFDQHWKRGITGLPTIVTSIDFNGTDLGTGSVPQAMAIRWAPSSSAALAELVALNWLDAAITVRIGAGPTPPVITVGKVIDMNTDSGVMTLALSDPAADLKKPIVKDRYSGTGGVEGPAEWQGKLKRRVWGRVFNLEGEPIDPAHQVYCFGDPNHSWAEISTVRDKGATAASLVLLPWQGSVASTFSALQDAVAPVGGGVICPSIACVKWWTQPAGSLCADVKGEIGAGYQETAPAIAERIVAAVSSVPFAAGTVAAAIVARPAVVGWVAADENGTASAALDALLGDVSLLWLLDNDQILLREWSWGAPVASVRSVDASRKAAFRPVSHRRLGYRRNQHVMARDAIAGIVLATDVVFEDGSTAVNLQASVAQAQSSADQAQASADQALDALKDANGSVVAVKDQLAAVKATLDAAVATARVEAGAARTEAETARTELADEVTRAKGAEGTLTVNLAAVQAVADQARASVTDEATVRATADVALSNRLSTTEAQLNGTQDSGLRARIVTEETARANQDNAIAARVATTEAQLNGSQDSNLRARIATEETARATQDAALANRASSLEASASASATGVALNPNFARWPDDSTLPAQWNYWQLNGGRVARSGGGSVRGSLFSVDLRNDNANLPWGLVQSVYMMPGKWVIEVVASADAGGLSGAGVTLSGIANLDFVGDADSNNAIGNLAGVRSWSKMIDWTQAPGAVNLHAMCGWEGFGRPIDPKYIRWFYLNVRPATDGEIKAGKALADAGIALSRITTEETTRASQDTVLANRITTTEAQLAGSQGSYLQSRIASEETARANQDAALANRTATVEAQLNGSQDSNLRARITTTESAIASLNGRTSAYWQVVAIAAGNRAQMTLWADANGGAGVDIVSDVRITGSDSDGSAVLSGRGVFTYYPNGAPMVRLGRW